MLFKFSPLALDCIPCGTNVAIRMTQWPSNCYILQYYHCPVHLPQLLQLHSALFLVQVEEAGTLQLPGEVTGERRVGNIISNGDISWSEQQHQSPGKMCLKISHHSPHTPIIVVRHDSCSRDDIIEEGVAGLETEIIVTNENAHHLPLTPPMLHPLHSPHQLHCLVQQITGQSSGDTDVETIVLVTMILL